MISFISELKIFTEVRFLKAVFAFDSQVDEGSRTIARRLGNNFLIKFRSICPTA